MSDLQGQLRKQQPLRCYHFGNMYLSSIQQGIQAAHVQMEMFVKYRFNTATNTYRVDMLHEWATSHKTMICLNAGMDVEMQKILALFERSDNPYPWAAFHESNEAMSGMLTNIAIILPENIYDVSDKDLYEQKRWAQSFHHLTDFDKDLIKMKNQYRMAR